MTETRQREARCMTTRREAGMRQLFDDRYETLPWESVDTFVFDIGGVIISFNPAELASEIFPEDPALADRIRERTAASPYWGMLDRGTIDYREAEDLMTGMQEELRPAIRRFLGEWVRHMKPVPEGIALLREAKRRGKQVLILSNNHRKAFDLQAALNPVLLEPDGCLISSDVQILKPDPCIYRILQIRYSLNPERTLFIDDNPVNVESALQLGWQGFCLNRRGKLAAFTGLEE